MPVKQFLFKQSEGTPYFAEDTSGFPDTVDFKIYTGADPEDKVHLFIGSAPNVKEVTYEWTHREFPSAPMDPYFMGSSILFDVEDMDGRDILAQLLTKIANEYRQEVNSVFARGWMFRDGQQTYYEYSNVDRPGADKVVTPELPRDPTWDPIGVNHKMLEDQIKVRKYGNKVDFEHGIPKFNLSVTQETAQEVDPGEHKHVLANTTEWTDLGVARDFLGMCKLHRINMFCGALSEEYKYGSVPSWVNINPLSRIGVIDMLRPSAPAPGFPWIGITDYVKLDYRCPQFSFHVGRMSYNPRIQIIVVLHDIASDIPESLDEDGRSKFHEAQFKVLAESVRHQNNRKPILFKVSIPGVAAALQDAGIHVSPTVSDCMNDLAHVIDLYMQAGEIKTPGPSVELIEDADEFAAKIIQGVTRKWLSRRSTAAFKIQSFVRTKIQV